MRHTTPAASPDHANASGFAVSRSERVRIGILYALISGATVFGFVAAFVIGQLSPVLAGLGLFAYALGLRHGVDADHIVAIDNTTRKLLQDGQRPFTVGTWFSLGHSAIVFIAGDDAAAKATVAKLIDEIGFASIDTGSLREGGHRQQPGSRIYGRPMTVREAKQILG